MQTEPMQQNRQRSTTYFQSLYDRQMMPVALRVAVVVGSLLFAINHGWAVVQRQMTPARWISGGLTYIVPYLVNIHGQHTSRVRSRCEK